MFYRQFSHKISKNIKLIRNMASFGSVVDILNRFAPLSLAEKWDNVGILIEPSDSSKMEIQKIFLTNDLTELVLDEAIKEGTNFIISYHPPIFAPLKRITQSNWKERIVVKCLENKIALYSPHTSWDCVLGGVNDWLFDQLQVPCSSSAPINVPNPEEPQLGSGRIYEIKDDGVLLQKFVENLKANTQLSHVQVATAKGKSLNNHVIKKLALCAGSGGSLLKNVTADLFVTGEMSHHEVLDAVHRGTSVILTNHSNSERGFLQKFQKHLQKEIPSVEIVVSKIDADPLFVV